MLTVHEIVHDDRLRGVRDWDDVAELGSSNLDRLVRFAQNAQLRELVDATRDERRAWHERLTWLREAAEAHPQTKPLLPRLRIESFRVGQDVDILVADTPDAQGGPWVRGTVIDVTKAHRSQWSDHPARGYYWRVTARTTVAVLDGRSELSFSTSEPRVLRPDERSFLTHAQTQDPRFFSIFVENARRDWHPLWALQTGRTASGEALDLGHWLSTPSSHRREEERA